MMDEIVAVSTISMMVGFILGIGFAQLCHEILNFIKLK